MMDLFGGKSLNFGSPLKISGIQKKSLSAPEPAAGGEPSLTLAIQNLSQDEANEVRSWGHDQKALFLQVYEWLSVAQAKNLEKIDGSAFNGFFQQALAAAASLNDIATQYKASFSTDVANGLQDAMSAEKDAKTSVLPKVVDLVKRYRLLRDRVAWELSDAGENVVYDVVGNDPSNPGYIFQRSIGDASSPTLPAVYSGMSQREAVESGEDLEETSADFGVPFKRLDLSGANLSQIGVMPIMAAMTTQVVNVLGFYHLTGNVYSGDLVSATKSAVSADPSLPEADRSTALAGVDAAAQVFHDALGHSFPWGAVLLVGAAVGLTIYFWPNLMGQGAAQ